jgi:hypothetical protein
MSQEKRMLELLSSGKSLIEANGIIRQEHRDQREQDKERIVVSWAKGLYTPPKSNRSITIINITNTIDGKPIDDWGSKQSMGKNKINQIDALVKNGEWNKLVSAINE